MSTVAAETGVNVTELGDYVNQVSTDSGGTGTIVNTDTTTGGTTTDTNFGEDGVSGAVTPDSISTRPGWVPDDAAEVTLTDGSTGYVVNGTLYDRTGSSIQSVAPRNLVPVGDDRFLDSDTGDIVDSQGTVISRMPTGTDGTLLASADSNVLTDAGSGGVVTDTTAKKLLDPKDLNPIVKAEFDTLQSEWQQLSDQLSDTATATPEIADRARAVIAAQEALLANPDSVRPDWLPANAEVVDLGDGTMGYRIDNQITNAQGRYLGRADTFDQARADQIAAQDPNLNAVITPGGPGTGSVASVDITGTPAVDTPVAGGPVKYYMPDGSVLYYTPGGGTRTETGEIWHPSISPEGYGGTTTNPNTLIIQDQDFSNQPDRVITPGTGTGMDQILNNVILGNAVVGTGTPGTTPPGNITLNNVQSGNVTGTPITPVVPAGNILGSAVTTGNVANIATTANTVVATDTTTGNIANATSNISTANIANATTGNISNATSNIANVTVTDSTTGNIANAVSNVGTITVANTTTGNISNVASTITTANVNNAITGNITNAVSTIGSANISNTITGNVSNAVSNIANLVVSNATTGNMSNIISTVANGIVNNTTAGSLTNVIASGNITGSNNVIGPISNVQSNVISTGNVTGPVIPGNVVTATGNITTPGGNVSVPGNVITPPGNVSVPGNVVTTGPVVPNVGEIVITANNTPNANVVIGNTTPNGNIVIANTTSNLANIVIANTTSNLANIVANTISNTTSNVSTVGNVVVIPNVTPNVTPNIVTTLSTVGNIINLRSGGLNPGYIAPPTFYPTTDSTQSQFYWGQRPYQTGGPTGQVFDPVLYNTVPSAPAVPWGQQRPTTQFSSYNSPPVGAMGPVGVRVAGAKTTPISPYTSTGAAPSAASSQLAYDQQLALASGNMEAYWALQAQIDAGGKPTTAVAPVQTAPVAQAPMGTVAAPVAPSLDYQGSAMDPNLYYYGAANEIVGYKPAYWETYGPAGKPG